MRQRAAQYNKSESALMDNTEDYFPCVYCGPPTKYDFDTKAQDDEGEAIMIHENMKCALANRLRPNSFRCYAGTVPCPQCCGNPLVHRHTPNFERFFNLQLPWQFQVDQRVGYLSLVQYQRDSAAPAHKHKAPMKFLEYPSRPPPLPEGRKAEPSPKVRTADEDGSFAMSAKDQFKLDDYVLKYVEDEEE